MELTPVRNPDEFLSSVLAFSSEGDNDSVGRGSKGRKSGSSVGSSKSVGRSGDVDSSSGSGSSALTAGRTLRLGSYVRWSRNPGNQLNP
jgi:hypothetical protein